MNEIRVIQEFKGINEDIAEKKADQLFKSFKECEMKNATSTNDTN